MTFNHRFGADAGFENISDSGADCPGPAQNDRSARMRMQTKSIVCGLLIAGVLVVQPQFFAQEKSRNTLSDDPATA